MNRETELLTSLLKKRGYSLTAPRLKLFRVLQNHNACSIAELTSLLSDYDRATVYRNVALFERLGIVNRLQLGWKYKLELSDVFHHHHHHLTCTNCGRITVLKEDPLIEARIRDLGKTGSFYPADHQLEITGLCQRCHTKL